MDDAVSSRSQVDARRRCLGGGRIYFDEPKQWPPHDNWSSGHSPACSRRAVGVRRCGSRILRSRRVCSCLNMCEKLTARRDAQAGRSLLGT